MRVTLDGVEQRQVTEYDMDAGWIERNVLIDGRIQIENDQIATERVSGAVEAEWME